ncbi:AlpA family phage regulatory protein [Salmonella enterica]|nr:AlpA family phage regulatory protein [Salmonella enterica]
MAAPAKKIGHKPFDPSKKHIRIKEVREKVWRSTAWVYAEMAKGNFPESVKISPCLVVWREEDIDNYLIEMAKRCGSGVVEGY